MFQEVFCHFVLKSRFMKKMLICFKCSQAAVIKLTNQTNDLTKKDKSERNKAGIGTKRLQFGYLRFVEYQWEGCGP